MLFIEESSPPPFYQDQLSKVEREKLDKWFIGDRSQKYYLKRFAEFDRQGYLSPKWHWASFFVTFGWLLYRKRYLDTIVYTVAGWSFIQLNIAIILVAFETVFMGYVPAAYEMMTRIGIAGLIWVFWSIMVARWTDAYYYRMARREIADAVADYPKEPAKQKAHLEREGGVSPIGLGIAFATFMFFLLIIQVQFLPLYAKPKERAIIQEAYELTRTATNRVETVYQTTGICPVDLPLHTSEQRLTLQVVSQSSAISNQKSPCVVIATLRNVPFPNRNLNHKMIIMYRDSSAAQSHWQCTTSFNAKQQPKRCLNH